MKDLICVVKEPWETSQENVKRCLELGITRFIAPPELVSKIKPLGRAKVISSKNNESTDGLLLSSPDESKIHELKAQGFDISVEFVIQRKSDEKRAIAAATAGADRVLVSTTDWKIIPFENLIAELHDQGCQLFAKVETVEDAKLAIHTLEVGVDGLVISSEVDWLSDIAQEIRGTQQAKFDLTPSEIIEIRTLSNGERVCIDTCSLLVPGEGMLVGSQSDTFYLIHGETLKTEFADPRPFRVNAGAVHAYALMADGRTKYLSELSSGDEVAIVNDKGMSRIAIIGRNKIETRPLLLIRSQAEESFSSIILQNAETIMLVSRDGEAKSVASLEVGDSVLVHRVNGGRHFGKAIQETIVEK
ncbi:MAG: 3-dehydroquinate synthase II [Candidatus Heimdallarchaeota archaeon]